MVEGVRLVESAAGLTAVRRATAGSSLLGSPSWPSSDFVSGSVPNLGGSGSGFGSDFVSVSRAVSAFLSDAGGSDFFTGSVFISRSMEGLDDGTMSRDADSRAKAGKMGENTNKKANARIVASLIAPDRNDARSYS